MAGVIIHENRFTYQQRGLLKIIDLGEYWEQQTNAPIPLGGIITRRSFPGELQRRIDQLVEKSVLYAIDNYPLVTGYVQQHAREMEESVMRKHIDLYVNNYSINLGSDGKAAVNTLLQLYDQVNGNGITERADIFIDENS